MEKVLIAEILTKKHGRKIVVEQDNWRGTPMGNVREWIYQEELGQWLPSRTVGLNLPIWLWEEIVKYLPAMLGKEPQAVQ